MHWPKISEDGSHSYFVLVILDWGPITPAPRSWEPDRAVTQVWNYRAQTLTPGLRAVTTAHIFMRLRTGELSLKGLARSYTRAEFSLLLNPDFAFQDTERIICMWNVRVWVFYLWCNSACKYFSLRPGYIRTPESRDRIKFSSLIRTQWAILKENSVWITCFKFLSISWVSLVYSSHM